MRAVNGKLLLAENGAGKVDALTIKCDAAHVTVLQEGLDTPTAVELAGETIWIGERRGQGPFDSTAEIAIQSKGELFCDPALWVKALLTLLGASSARLP